MSRPIRRPDPAAREPWADDPRWRTPVGRLENSVGPDDERRLTDVERGAVEHDPHGAEYRSHNPHWAGTAYSHDHAAPVECADRTRGGDTFPRHWGRPKGSTIEERAAWILSCIKRDSGPRQHEEHLRELRARDENLVRRLRLVELRRT